MKTNIIKDSVSAVTLTLNRLELKGKKYSPEILFGLGVVAFGATVVAVIKNTMKIEPVLDEHKEKAEIIHAEVKSSEGDVIDDVSDSVKRKEMVQLYAKTAGNVIKVYAPSITFGTLSIACFLASNRIIKARYVGAVAAYNAVSTAFDAYRERVRNEYGEDVERHLYYGTTIDEVETTVTNPETGKKKKVTEKVELPGDGVLPPFSVVFDSSNVNWNDEYPPANMMFLRGQNEAFNNLFHAKGHLFLNNILSEIGFKDTPEGSVVGWIDNSSSLPMKYVDFGLFDQNTKNTREILDAYYASIGAEREKDAILLSFNVDGVIWDKI